ncbi:MAG TPA: beta-ketoacyl-ACP synthase III [Gemmatimonadota bacterium]|nr:beta-ketoacyl-ACP synthase III [Gemmatimonadota bacterium]
MSQRPTRSIIASTGMTVPDKIVTNADFERIVDTSDEWIATRTGIKERRMCAEGQHTADLAADAGRKALEEAGLSPADVDVLILSTATPDHLLPATACETQALLGLENAVAFDISAACAGWLYGITLADALLTSALYENVLVIGAEKMSAILDYTDRTTCVLFGDGAGAGLVVPGDGNRRGILASYMRTNGRQATLLWRPAGGAAMPSTEATRSEGMEYVKQEGREIFKQAVTCMEDACRRALEIAGMTIADVDLVIPHQANIRIIEGVAKRLGVENDRVFVNIDRYGNTSSASIPIAFDEARRQGRAGEGSTVLMTAFGGGLAWGSALIKL